MFSSTQRLLASAIATLASLPSFAQSAPSTGNDLLETVLVTATRQGVSGGELPVAWSAIDQDTIGFTSPQHANQLLNRSAGTWISRGNGQESLIALRSPVLTGAGSCGAFMTAEDGIPLRAPGFCNVNQLFDANLAQAGAVEVVRGPATAVYGSNGMHGVINVITPSVESRPNTLRIEGGSRDFYRLLGNMALPDNSTAIAFQASEYGGYQAESGYGQQKLNVRNDSEWGAWRLASVLSGSNLNQETAGYIQGFEAYKDDAARRDNPNPEAYRDAWSMRAHVSASRNLGSDQTLTITPYVRRNAMTFLQHFVPWQPTERNGHSSVGLQTSLAGGSDNSQWVIGADLDYTQGWLEEVQAEPFSPNQPAGIHYDYEVDALVGGLFAQGDTALSDRWRIDGGVRLESTQYDYDNLASAGSACAPDASACRFFRPADRSDDFNNLSANLALSYGFDNARVYTRAASGFRAPQTAELYRLQAGQTVANIDSEQIHSIELGIRGELFDALGYALNAYQMRKDNVIFQDRDRQNVDNAKTRHEGIEIELNWQISSVWYAELAATLQKHRYDSATALLGSSGDIKGNRIDTAPDSFGSARLGADTVIGIHPIKAELEYVWVGGYYVDPNNEHRYTGHRLVNLRADMQVRPKIKLSVIATNLLDTAYAERADFGFGQYRYFVGEPRSVVLGLSWQLD